VLTNADGQSLTRELRLGLRDHGYSEGQNFVFQLRSAEGDAGRLPQLATQLASAQVDVIVATFTPCALAAKQATTSIPIVMAAVADPIAVGLVTSLARPGGTVTGFSNMAAETAGKSVELFRDMLPSIGRVAVVANPADPFTTSFLEQVDSPGGLWASRSILWPWLEDVKKQKPPSLRYPGRGRKPSLFRGFSFPRPLLTSR
jgi:putative tryptophan/tyrosine transport system substrate-binding protein